MIIKVIRFTVLERRNLYKIVCFTILLHNEEQKMETETTIRVEKTIARKLKAISPDTTYNGAIKDLLKLRQGIIEMVKEP